MILKGIGAAWFFQQESRRSEILEANLALSDVTTVSAGGSQCFPPV